MNQMWLVIFPDGYQEQFTHTHASFVMVKVDVFCCQSRDYTVLAGARCESRQYSFPLAWAKRMEILFFTSALLMILKIKDYTVTMDRYEYQQLENLEAV